MSYVLPDNLRKSLGSKPLSIANNVREVIHGDLGISVAHEPCDDVNRCAGFE